jgi:hypothetical protein
MPCDCEFCEKERAWLEWSLKLQTDSGCYRRDVASSLTVHGITCHQWSAGIISSWQPASQDSGQTWLVNQVDLRMIPANVVPWICSLFGQWLMLSKSYREAQLVSMCATQKTINRTRQYMGKQLLSNLICVHVHLVISLYNGIMTHAYITIFLSSNEEDYLYTSNNIKVIYRFSMLRKQNDRE